MNLEEAQQANAVKGATPEFRANGPFGKLALVAAQDVAALHLRLRFLNAFLILLPHLCFNRLRTALYRLIGIKISERSLILGNLELTGTGPIWRRLRIGKGCRINAHVYFDLNANITIGNRVSIGHHVVLITTDHDTSVPTRREGELRHAPIVIGDGSWIGAGAMILPGVTLGEGSVVSSGAVVFADVPAHKLVGGNPARPIKSLPEQSP